MSVKKILFIVLTISSLLSEVRTVLAEQFDVLCSQIIYDAVPEGTRGAMLFAYLKSKDADLTSQMIKINSESIESWHSRKVVAWWRLRPNPIKPGTCGELAIRFQSLPEKSTVRITLERQSFNVPTSPPSIKIVYAVCDEGLNVLTFYVKNNVDVPTRITDVRVDGRSILERCTFSKPQFFCNVAPVRVSLSESWEQGSYHIVEIVAGNGARTAAQIRAWSPGFEIGTFGNHYFDNYKAHGINTYQSFGWLSSDILDRAKANGLRVTMPFFGARRAYFYDNLPLNKIEERMKQVAKHPALFAHYLEDEPDVFDWFYPATFRQEVIFQFPREVTIARVRFEGLDQHGIRCELQSISNKEWRTIAKHDAWSTSRTRNKPEPLDLKFAATPTKKVKLVIERCRDIPVISEVHFFSSDGIDISSNVQVKASSRMDKWYGRDNRGPEKMVDGNPKTSWRAGHSYHPWVGNMALEMVKREAMCKRFGPKTASMCLVNNTYRPGNYFSYGHIADVFDTDIYLRPASGVTMDWTEVARRTKIVRQACAPKPLWITLWMGWGSNYCRTLTESEERIMTFYAIGQGAKGINYFLHSGGTYSIITGMIKTQRKEEGRKYWEGIGRLNKQLRRAGYWIARSQPVDAQIEASNGLWVKTLLCNCEALVLVIVNQRASGTGESFKPSPIHDAKITTDVPSWLRRITAQRVLPGSLEPLNVQLANGRAQVELPIVEDAEIIVLSTGE